MRRNSTLSLPGRQVGFFVALLCTRALFAEPIAQTSELSGRVLDADGRPIASALVIFTTSPVDDGGQSTYSDSTGLYRLPTLSSPIGQIRVEALGYRPLTRSIDLRSSDTTVDFYLQLQPLQMDELIVYRPRSKDDASFVETITVDRRSGDLAQLLDAATGLNTRRYGGLGSFSTVSIRGSTSEQVQIFLDGVPLNSASGGGVDVGSLSLAGVEQIEIHRGTAPSQFGGNSIGGVVHMRTRGLEAPQQTHLHAEAGSFATRQLGFSHSGRLGLWHYLSLADYRASDNTFRFWDDNGTEYNAEDDEWATRRNSDFAALRILSKAGRLLGAHRLQIHSTLDWSHKGIPGLGNNQSLHTRFDTWRHIAEVNFYGPHTRGGSMRLKSYYSEQRDTYKDLLGEVGTGQQHQRNATRSVGLRGEWNVLWHRDMLANAFAELRREHFSPRDALRANESPNASRRSSATLGLQLEKGLFDQRLATQIGGQIERQRNRFFIQGNGPFTSADTLRSTGVLWSARWSLSARLSAHISARAHSGIYRRAPSFFELFGDRGAVIGNAELNSETGHNSDVGLVYRAAQNKRIGVELFEVAYYRNRVRDLIRFIHNSQQVSRPYNVGKALLQGVETRWQARLFSRLVTTGNYTYQRAENRAPFSFEKGRDLPNAPRHRLSNRIALRAAPWETWFEHQWESRHFLDRANLRPVARRLLYHIGVRRAIGEAIELRAEMRNVGDNRVADLWGYPLPGRSYALAVEHTFLHP